MKIWSRSGDTCLADMYTPWSMYGWSMVSQGCSCLMLFVFVWWAKVAHVLCCLCLYGESRLFISYVVCVCMVSQGCSCLMLFVFVWWAKVVHILCCLCLYGEPRLLMSYVVCVCMYLFVYSGVHIKTMFSLSWAPFFCDFYHLYPVQWWACGFSSLCSLLVKNYVYTHSFLLLALMYT